MEEIKIFLTPILTVFIGILGYNVRSVIESNNRNTSDITNLRNDYTIAKQQIEYLRKEMDNLTNKFDTLREKVLKCKSCNS